MLYLLSVFFSTLLLCLAVYRTCLAMLACTTTASSLGFSLMSIQYLRS